MANYEYLIAGLPDISHDWKGADAGTADAIMQEIRELSSEKDNRLIDKLLEGYQDDKLNLEFYQEMLSSKDAFLKEYFRFDLNVRNAKVAYLNRELRRPAGTDVFLEAPGEFEEAQRLEAVLNTDDILARERGIDDLMWSKIDELTTFDYFDIDAVLGFIAKLHIVSRWLKLDDATGRQMFARLVDEVRGSYTGIRAAADKAVS